MSAEDKQKKALEERGRAVGIEVDRRNSLEDITAQVEAAEAAAAAAADEPAVEAAAADEPAVEAAPKYPYSIAEGKSITTRGGLKSSGQEITAHDLADGDAGLARLVKSKHIVKA